LTECRVYAQIEKATIKIVCYDVDTFKRWDIIGMNQYDMKAIYMEKNHELYRAWVPLFKFKNREQSPQGFLRVSVTVLGPGRRSITGQGAHPPCAHMVAAVTTGDTQAQHNLEEEVMKEQADDGLEGGLSGVAAGNLAPREQTLHFLVVTIFDAENLPMMDTLTLSGSSGIDGLVQVDMGYVSGLKVPTRPAASGADPALLPPGPTRLRAR
jgi:hypothetical protein